jgi:hypothetical protein
MEFRCRGSRNSRLIRKAREGLWGTGQAGTLGRLHTSAMYSSRFRRPSAFCAVACFTAARPVRGSAPALRQLYLERLLNFVCQSAQLHMLTKPRKIAHRAC